MQNNNLFVYVRSLSKQLRGNSKILCLQRTFAIRSLFSAIIMLGFYSQQAYAEKTMNIVALGDSLTAGYQLPPNTSFPAQLEETLKTKGHNIKVTNAGVSGDTTAGGLARVDWSVPKGTDAVILELGANDALRGISPDETRKNLDTTLQKLKAKGIMVLLVGMRAPQSFGKKYTDKFNAIYKDLSQKHDTLLYPFFLEGIAQKQEYNLSDGMHPNPKGVKVIVNNILPYVEQLIEKAKNR